MAILIIEIAMLVYGIIAISKGRYKVGKTHEVVGGKARIIGGVLMCPLPTAFVAGMIIGALYLAQHGRPPRMEDLQTTAIIMEVSILVFFALLAFILSSIWKQPIGQNQYGQNTYTGPVAGNFQPPVESDNPYQPPSNQ